MHAVFGSARGAITPAPAGIEKLADYDRNGPAIFAGLLDLTASVASSIPVELMHSRADGLDVAAGEVVRVLIAHAVPHLETQLARLIRALERDGRAAIVKHNRPNSQGVRIEILSVTALQPEMRGSEVGYHIGHCETGSGKKEDREWIPQRRVTIAIQPDPDNPCEPWTPYARVCKELGMIRLATRTVERRLQEILALSRVMFFEGDPAGLQRRSPDGNMTTSGLGMVIQNLLSVMRENLQDVEGNKIQSASIVPVVGTNPPVLIDTAPALDATLLQLWDRAVKAFAQATPWPTLFVTEGTGASNRASAEVQDDQATRHAIVPTLTRALRVFETHVLWPLLAAAGIPDPESYWFRPNVQDDLNTATVDVEKVAEAWRNGIITREAYARYLGIHPNDILPLPDGVTDWEVWLSRVDRQIDRSGSQPEALNALEIEQPVAAALSTIDAEEVPAEWWVA
jgi:hypothetical protein